MSEIKKLKSITNLHSYPLIKMKPLTNNMEHLLMDIHERELLKLDPYEAGTTKFCKGLIERGLLETKDFTTQHGKKILSLYVTKPGRSYLDNLK